MQKPNLMEEVVPGSGQYSFKTDLRLNVWLLVAVAVYLCAMYAVKEHPDWNRWMKGALVSLPVIPGLLYGRSLMRFFRGLDELQRRIQTEAAFFATFGTVLVTAVVNTLNEQGVPTWMLDRGVGVGGCFMLLLFLWSIGYGIASCRYK